MEFIIKILPFINSLGNIGQFVEVAKGSIKYKKYSNVGKKLIIKYYFS